MGGAIHVRAATIPSPVLGLEKGDRESFGTDFDEFRLTGGAAWMCQQVDQGWVFCIAHGGNQDA